MTETELKYNRDLCAPSRSALTRSACTGTARVPRVHPGDFPGERSERGNLLTTMKYTAYGELRSGTSTTDYQYTLQKHPGQAGRRNESEIGLYYYVARYYDPALGRFRGLCAPELRALPALERFLFHGCEREGKSADTIVPEPGSIKAYDRYAYVNGNPVKYNDPSGHRLWEGEGGGGTPYKFLLEYKYKVITTTINLVHLETIYNGVEDMANAMGGSN